ncbi:MAG: hypothetical protein CR966_00085 [Pseudomonadales bacterium]|nr:MAG: hypothetical protein CR966_00085 [Pseudomonadales bacterium]
MGKELLEGLKSKEIPQDLTPHEISIIKLIYQYHQDGLADHTKKAIRHKFRSLYQEVNLTRLVVLRLLKFEHSDDVTIKATAKSENNSKINKPVNNVKSGNNISTAINDKPKKPTGINAVDPLLMVVSGNYTD